MPIKSVCPQKFYEKDPSMQKIYIVKFNYIMLEDSASILRPKRCNNIYLYDQQR